MVVLYVLGTCVCSVMCPVAVRLGFGCIVRVLCRCIWGISLRVHCVFALVHIVLCGGCGCVWDVAVCRCVECRCVGCH